MLSEAQRIEKENRIKKVVDTFLSYKQISINELSRILKISSSTIQRDLNDVDFITTVYGSMAKSKLEEINKRLKQNKDIGHSTGGINSTKNNMPIRDDNGKFTGNKKR